MLFVVLLLVANYVGQLLYANYVGQLLYVVFVPPAKCQHHGQTAPPRKTDGHKRYISSVLMSSLIGRRTTFLMSLNSSLLMYFVFSFAIGENSKHRNDISKTRLLILIFIVICYFWRFICFVAVFCSLVDNLTT